MEADLPHINFRMDDGKPGHLVPADVLADVLKHAQRAVHLLAMAEENREVRQRARIPADIAKRFALLCEVPEPGSYVQPVVVADLSNGLFATLESEAVLDSFKAVSAAISEGRLDDVRTSVQDRSIRLRVLDEFASMMPQQGDDWTLGLSNGVGPIAEFGAEHARSLRDHLRRARQPQAPATATATLAGQLIQIDFAAHKLTIRLHPTNRALDCDYTEDVEEMLLDNRRDWIQVTGLVELDDLGRPTRLSDVFDIQNVDLSPLSVEAVRGDARNLRFIGGARTFGVSLDESGTLLVVEDEEIGVHAYAETRADLEVALAEDLMVLWHEYAEAASDDLTDDAADLRDALRTHLTNDDAQTAA